MKIIGTGLSGLVGSRIVDLLKDKYEFVDLSLKEGFDVRHKEFVFKAISESDASIVLHLAAKTDVDGCEQEKAQGTESDAWKINVEGTQNVSEACKATGKMLIYFSTDFVFDGKKEVGGYKEEDMPNPINFYARTKYEGEKIVQSFKIPWIIARLAYPYRASFLRKDFVRRMMELFETDNAFKIVTDHVISPTFIDDLAPALDALIRNKATGIFHVVGSSSLSPAECGAKIAEKFIYNKLLMMPVKREDFFKNKACRPFRLAMRNDKIQRLGVKMRTFDEGLEELKRQLSGSTKSRIAKLDSTAQTILGQNKI